MTTKKKSVTSFILLCSLLCITHSAFTKEIFAPAQTKTLKAKQQEILRGTITPERAWWDLTHYNLNIKVDPEAKTIAGTNTMKYVVLSEQKQLQIELQAPLILEKVTQNNHQLTVSQQGYSYFINTLPHAQIGKEYELVMHFSGVPQEAIKAPWDGGITWSKDDNDIDFIASSCQGIGASIWWPNKDHAYDEPNNGVFMSVEVPEHLFNVSNGRLKGVDHNKNAKTKTYHWEVLNPINNYGVNINIGDYVTFSEVYHGENGPLDMHYYVLRENLSKAKKQFKDAKRTIEALEHWFGPYPFYEDSYKLVEAPYLGMEHQSSVTYGNKYQNGYLGTDRSQTGVGMLFDFIIVHETGHEWFANNITHVDVADMWIHESFTSYSENLFVEYHFDKEKAFEYIRGQRMNIKNASPIIGTYNIHQEGSSDMYDKGANMLHTIRQIVNNDTRWRSILRGLNNTFFHKTVTTQQVENFINQESGHDFSHVFDQYLRDIRIPTFEFFVKDNVMKIKWSNVVKGFTMPIKIFINNKAHWVTPTQEWTNVEITETNPKITVDPNFYINTLNILGH